ncbi:MAG: DUF2142 domain-containing protein [Bacteroidota bacterium]
MPPKKHLIAAICFLLLSIFALRFYVPSPPMLDITQTTRCKNPYLDDGFIKGIVLVQEVTLKKDYLNGFHIRYITMDRENTNTNTIVVFDNNFNLLFKEKFSSKDIEDRKFHAFQFRESLKIGKGNKISICFLSQDGDSLNCVHSLFNKEASIGNLYACALSNDDLIASLHGKHYPYPGAIFLRTYESDSSRSAAISVLLHIVALLVALAIAFFAAIRKFLAGIRIRPEYVYLVFALAAGLAFLFLTPPLQVPDEGSHLARVAELSEGQISSAGKTIPSAFAALDSTFLRLHANPDERTSLAEIVAQEKLTANPAIRHSSKGPAYTIPYIAPLAGFFTGKIFSTSPLILMYFARLFNLLCSILLVFMAIRMAPVGKWIFFLLALMPKTLFLMASLSYDAFVISGSFLLTAMFLYYAFRPEKVMTWKDLGLLSFLWVLLLFCKPPYFILGALFFIIPFSRTRSLSKYLLAATILVCTLLLGFGIWKLAAGGPAPGNTVKSEQLAGQVEQGTPGLPPALAANGPKPEINPPKQIEYIRTHLKFFVNLLITTNFYQMRADMLNNFVGTLGWLDTFIPDSLVNLYLIVLLVTAICMAEEKVKFGWKSKLMLFLLFLVSVLAIETAMYIYTSFFAQEKLFGIQGRYFIPLAPLILLVAYNNRVSGKLNFLLSPGRDAWIKSKPTLKSKMLLEIQDEQIFSKFLQVFIIGLSAITLVRGIAAVLLRYYLW